LLNAGTMYFVVAYQSSPAEEQGWNLSVGPTTTIYDNAIGSPTGPWSEDSNSSKKRRSRSCSRRSQFQSRGGVGQLQCIWMDVLQTSLCSLTRNTTV
jgi:hypothetical protein